MVLATQLLAPFKSVTCSEGGDDDDSNESTCTGDQVNTYSLGTYKATDGPERFTKYSVACLLIGLVSLVVVTPFLPRTKATPFLPRSGSSTGSRESFGSPPP